MYVISPVEGKTYEKLIDYAGKKCDAVMFVIRRDLYINELRIDNNSLDELKKNMKKYTTEIKNHLLKIRHGAKWVYSESGANDDMFDIYFYKFDNVIKKLLLENKFFYKWLHPFFPEDIAFFKNRQCWLYTVAHEETCEIYYETDEEYQELINLGIDFEEKYILPIEKRYYEKY